MYAKTRNEKKKRLWRAPTTKFSYLAGGLPIQSCWKPSSFTHSRCLSTLRVCSLAPLAANRICSSLRRINRKQTKWFRIGSRFPHYFKDMDFSPALTLLILAASIADYNCYYLWFSFDTLPLYETPPLKLSLAEIFTDTKTYRNWMTDLLRTCFKELGLATVWLCNLVRQ